MVLSCRHCYAPEELSSFAEGVREQQHLPHARAASAPPQIPSYSGTLIYGSQQNLATTVDAIEKYEQGTIAGITVW